MENNVKLYRKAKRLTQEKLAKMTNISRPHIARIENSQNEPTISIAYRISKALDRTIEEIFFSDAV